MFRGGIARFDAPGKPFEIETVSLPEVGPGQILPDGLSGAVWAADTDRALAFARGVQTGQLDINGGRYNPAAPFGGYKKSGIGRELGRAGFEEYLQTKSPQLPA